MSERSAHATIKGYFYQFDKTILELLKANSLSTSVVVEGIEDIDLSDDGSAALIQCKYFEGTDFVPSVIKDAVIHMLRHFAAAGCPVGQTLRYRIYGHYKSGQGKLPKNLDLPFLKANLLTFTHKGKTHESHTELEITESQLTAFLNLLDIDINAPSYDSQQDGVRNLLISTLSSGDLADAEAFYYPRAITTIQNLAIQKDQNKRMITKAEFIAAIDKKEAVFSRWLNKKFGDAYYAKSVKRMHFRFPGTGIPKANRVFAIDLSDGVIVSKAIEMLKAIGDYFSNRNHRRTPAVDRFCPFVLLRNISDQDLIALKKLLYEGGVLFEDGYPFSGASFYPNRMHIPPTEERPLKMKFIPTAERLAECFADSSSGHIEVFDLFKSAPLNAGHRITNSSHKEIPVPHPYFLTEILQS